MKITNTAALLIFAFVLLSCGKTNKKEIKQSDWEKIEKLAALDKKMDEPKMGEWLFTNAEKGQSFEKYKTITPVKSSTTQNVIYILPIGSFTPEQFNVVQFTANYLRIFFGLQTTLLPTMDDSIIPEQGRRGAPDEREQLNSMYIINTVLPNKIPKNGLVLMAITAKDLYPKDSWNYVFGQASAKNRVAVSSIFRYSDAPITAKNYNLCLSRLIKTSAHEIGHMFSVNHCIFANCIMNGSNGLVESDERPNHLCSDCYKKLYWNLQFNPLERNKKLISFFKSHYLQEEVVYHEKMLEILKD